MKAIKIGQIIFVNAMLLTSGCTPLQYISISTNPTGASVYVDNQKLSSVTPLKDTIYFRDGKILSKIKIGKEGFQIGRAHV
jgi:hypothetical protein